MFTNKNKRKAEKVEETNKKSDRSLEMEKALWTRKLERVCTRPFKTE